MVGAASVRRRIIIKVKPMSPEQKKIIQQISNEVRARLEGEGSGHDWWHVERVWKMAQRIATQTKCNLFIVELAALLHDIADWKFHNGDDQIGPKVAQDILQKYSVSKDDIDHVCQIIATMSFKGAGVTSEMKTIEGQIVQDADRLDAMGAIGVARAFAYGGHKGRLLHHPDRKPVLHHSKEAYVKDDGPTTNHFYEKLLLLKERINTSVAREIAEGRHKFMEEYLETFLREWEGQQ